MKCFIYFHTFTDSWAMSKRHGIKASEMYFNKNDKVSTSKDNNKTDVNKENISAEIQTLMPCSKYDIRVYAENKIGMSSPSLEILRVHTKEEAPEGPPTSVIAISNTSQSLLISWKVRWCNLIHYSHSNIIISINLKTKKIYINFHVIL